MLVLNERHQVQVVLALDDEDALAGVTLGVRVLQDVEQVVTVDVKNDVLVPDAAIRLELRVLRVVPSEVLLLPAQHNACSDRHTLASSPVCPPVCPNAVQERSSGSQHQPAVQ